MSNDEELIEKILNNPKLLDVISKKVYDKIRDDIILKRIDEQSEIIKSLVENVNELRRSNEELRKSHEELKKSNEELRKAIRDNTDHITLLWESMYLTWKEIRDLKEENKKIWESIENINRTMKEEFERIWESIQRLEISISSFTSRAGHHIERAIMNLYKKALELHGIDSSKVIHGSIEDKYGVFAKGRTFEVDFYETNDYIYIFEIKNNADEGAVEQLEIREKLFSSLYNKPIKKFLVANSIEKNVKERAENLGITVIAGVIVE